MKQMMGIYEADWDTEHQIVIGEPFISYLVHDAVAAGRPGRQAARPLPPLEPVPHRRL